MLRRKRSCDDIFAEYLNFVARKVNRGYYAKVLSFVFLLRECVNEYAERLVAEQKNLPADLRPRIVPAEKTAEYCAANNAEQVPDISNEFITDFLPHKNVACINNEEAVNLMQNLCHWLFINGYTCSKLSLIQ